MKEYVDLAQKLHSQLRGVDENVMHLTSNPEYLRTHSCGSLVLEEHGTLNTPNVSDDSTGFPKKIADLERFAVDLRSQDVDPFTKYNGELRLGQYGSLLINKLELIQLHPLTISSGARYTTLLQLKADIHIKMGKNKTKKMNMEVSFPSYTTQFANYRILGCLADIKTKDICKAVGLSAVDTTDIKDDGARFVCN